MTYAYAGAVIRGAMIIAASAQTPERVYCAARRG
jgi:hypothetical protein